MNVFTVLTLKVKNSKTVVMWLLCVQCMLAVYVRVCIIRSVDGTSVTAYAVHECEGSTRMGARPRRYIFTGHSNGSIQVNCLCIMCGNHMQHIATIYFNSFIVSGIFVSVLLVVCNYVWASLEG